MAACMVYITVALRRAYDGPTPVTVLRGLIATVSLIFVLSAYRFILLFTVLAFMR